jgi:cobyrinic acid a,c-diamide synthase
MIKGKGVKDGMDGFVINESGLAAYTHLHFTNNKLADRIVQACTRYSRR